MEKFFYQTSLAKFILIYQKNFWKLSHLIFFKVILRD